MQSLMNRAQEKNGYVQSKHFDTFFNQIDIKNKSEIKKPDDYQVFGEEADLIDSLIEIARHNKDEASTLLGL